MAKLESILRNTVAVGLIGLLLSTGCRAQQLSNSDNLGPVSSAALQVPNPDYSQLEDEVKAAAKWAILVVDMQPHFLDRVDEVERNREIANQQNVLEYCATHDIPVIVVEYNSRFPSSSLSTIDEIKEKVEKVPRHTYLNKTKPDGFTNPELTAQLREWGITDLLLMGCQASGCLYETAKGALGHFRIAVSRQLMMDERHQYGIPSGEMRTWYGRNGTYREDYEELLKEIH